MHKIFKRPDCSKNTTVTVTVISTRSIVLGLLYGHAQTRVFSQQGYGRSASRPTHFPDRRAHIWMRRVPRVQCGDSASVHAPPRQVRASRLVSSRSRKVAGDRPTATSKIRPSAARAHRAVPPAEPTPTPARRLQERAPSRDSDAAVACLQGSRGPGPPAPRQSRLQELPPSGRGRRRLPPASGRHGGCT